MSVSIDDFGTGYSSLAHLQKLSIARLKIDRSFIKELHKNSTDIDSAIMLAVIAIAHSLKLEAITEGVETLLQKDYLKQNNCNFAQGNFYSRPIPLDSFVLYLKDKKD
jgi:sensor c-di-GMP phosphodiesterase-like protein